MDDDDIELESMRHFDAAHSPSRRASNEGLEKYTVEFGKSLEKKTGKRLNVNGP